MVHILMGRKFFHDFYQFRKAYLLLVDFLTGMKKKTYIKLKASYQIPRHMGSLLSEATSGTTVAFGATTW